MYLALAETVNVVPGACNTGPTEKAPVPDGIITEEVIVVLFKNITLLLSKKAPEGIDTAVFDTDVTRPSAPTVIEGI
jgi:hypothetical protein